MPSSQVRAAFALLALAVPLVARPAVVGAQVPDPAPPPCGIGQTAGGFAPYRPPTAPFDVVVIPFTDGDPSTAPSWAGEGMARLIADHVDVLRGVSATAVRWPGPGVTTPSDAARIGRDLRARLVVTGAISRLGDRTSASMRVVRAADGAVVATDEVEFDWGRLPGIEARFATVVRRATGATKAGAARPVTPSALALESLMQGDMELRARDDSAPARAAAAYAAATRDDATFATAYVRLAGALTELAFRGPALVAGSSPTDLLGRARRSVDRAIELDAQSPWAWAVRGRIAALSGERTTARNAFARARALDPDLGEVALAEGRALLDVGDARAAEPLLVRAAERLPQRGEPLVAIAELRLARGDASGACRALNGALLADRRNPFAYALRGVARLRMRETREAWGDGETSLRLGRRSDGLSVMAVVDAQARDTASARARVRSLLGPGGPAPSRIFSPWEARLLSRAVAATGDASTAALVTRRARPVALTRFPL